jgi:tetratricopeptide (TPR) repeat protein
MAKIGRNDACPCGSGKKYKRCCLAKVEEAERQALAAAAAAPTPNDFGVYDDCYDELAAASNAALDLIDAGKLDEAEQAAHALLERFPDAHDGYARLGLVHEVRGANRQAVEYYRKVIAFARKRPGLYDSEFEDGYQALIDRLEPTAAD